ncbi:MAG: Hsp20/alpha crystallin family protein [Clostridia bacterium]|nr:Hsp20/alpha crystallin family protein [Clostridia bacterium]
MFELTPFFRTVPRTSRAASVYDPFRALDEFERSFFGERTHTFSTDIIDNGNSYTLQTDLPGFKKEDISIDISGETMTVKAERHSDFEDNDKKNNYVHIERSYGSYSRSFDISGIDSDKICAKYEDGVLSVELPKQEIKEPETRKLEIK